MGPVPVRLLYRVLPDEAWTEIGQTEAFHQKHDWEIPGSISGKVVIRAVWTLRVPIVVNSPAFQITRLRKSLPALSTARTVPPAASDYRIESVVFQDGRALSEGIMYSPEVFNDMKLIIRIIWNKAPARYGVMCENNKVTILDRSGVVILNPVDVPAPDGSGLITKHVQFRMPRGLREGTSYPFIVRFLPAHPDCDADASNNERSFNTHLVEMGGNDLVIRIVEVRVQRPIGFVWDQLFVSCEIMNISGTETLRRVKIQVEVEGATVTRTDLSVENLPPRVWARKSFVIPSRQLFELSGEETLIAIVDPDNEIAELREDNNRDGRRFRWK